MFSQGLPNHFKCFSENPVSFWGLIYLECFDGHYVKSVRIRSYFGPYFPAFGASIRIQSACGKISRSGWYLLRAKKWAAR